MLLEKWVSTCRRLKLDPCLLPCTKINSKWIKDYDIRHETLKQLQEAVGNTLEQTGIGNAFLNRTQKGSASMKSNEQMGLHQKASAQQRKQLPDSRDSPQNGRKSLPATHLIRD
jgi:hypothetical protein